MILDVYLPSTTSKIAAATATATVATTGVTDASQKLAGSSIEKVYAFLCVAAASSHAWKG